MIHVLFFLDFAMIIVHLIWRYGPLIYLLSEADAKCVCLPFNGEEGDREGAHNIVEFS